MKVRIHEVVLQKLGAFIVKGGILPLKNLPPESVLCHKYKIGRNTLREVFKVLSEKGLISASPRKGTWVTNQEEWDIFDSDVINWAAGTKLQLKILTDVNEARNLIEPAAARLAARYGRISDIAIIEDAYYRMEKARSNSVEACIADVDFHLGIFKASHNSLWIKFGWILSATLPQLFKETATKDRYKEALQFHKKILDAIRFKDENGAEECMSRLIQYAMDTFKIIKGTKNLDFS